MGPENTPHPAQFRLNKFIYIYIYIYLFFGGRGGGSGGRWWVGYSMLLARKLKKNIFVHRLFQPK